MTPLPARLRARRPLWGVYPTTRLALVVLVTGALWLVPGAAGRAVAIAAVAFVVTLVLFDYLRLPHARHVAVERSAPETIGLGDSAELTYVVRSDWAWPLRVALFDVYPTGIAATAPNRELSIDGHSELAITVPMTGQTRGRQSLAEMALRITTPRALLARLVRRQTPSDIIVIPSLTNVRRFRLLAMQHRLSEAGVRALKQRGEGTAFAGLRDYVPGDDPRLLDWKATARHGRLIAREQTVERSQTVISLIDCGRAMTQLAGTFARFEHVLSSALLLSDVAATGGDRVGLIAFDDQIRAFVPPQRGTQALRSLRTTMTALDATLTEPDYASAFRLLATRQRRRALVVFFTDVIDERAARQFVAYAGRAALRHAMVVVAIQNEALIAAARPASTGSLALYRSAAAEELVRERDEALARMRHAGITVLDVAPSRMAAAVVNRYLEIKSRGLL
ncbi:MAG: DUF58 domain-containing protein [Gemmatimonadaceae bacterium]